MFLVLFNFARDGASLGKVMRRVLRRTVLFPLSSFVLRGELERATDLLNETCEFFRRLGGDSLDISLEDEEILGFDENIMLDEGFVVCSVCDGPFIQFVLRGASCRDPTSFNEDVTNEGKSATHVL